MLLFTVILIISFYSYVLQLGINILRITAYGRDDDDRIKSVREFLWYLIPVIPSVMWVIKMARKMYKNLKRLPW
jgi:hypothetical protein